MPPSGVKNTFQALYHLKLGLIIPLILALLSLLSSPQKCGLVFQQSPGEAELRLESAKEFAPLSPN